MNKLYFRKLLFVLFHLLVFSNYAHAALAPGNDDPCNATPLPVASTCNFTQYTNVTATATTGVPAPGCANYQGADVWFSAAVPASGTIHFDTNAGGITDGGMAVYSGTCGALTLLGCNDDGTGLMPSITQTGLTPGSTVFIRFWGYGNNNTGTFSICAQAGPSCSGSSSNSTCTTADPFCTGVSYEYCNTTGVPSIGGSGIYGCLLTAPNPAFYFMNIATSGPVIFNISQQTFGGVGIDVDFVLWGPFASQASMCSSIAAGNIVDCSYSTAAVETATIPNAIAGQWYMILITNFSNQPGVISFNQTNSGNPGAGTTNCNILTAVPGVCSGGFYTLNGTVTVPAPPATGTLTVTNSCGGNQVINAPFTNPINYSIPNICGNGNNCNVSAVFSAGGAPVVLPTNYTAPSCNTLTAVPGGCTAGGYVLSGTLTTGCLPTTGTLTITSSCGGSVIFNAPFSSPLAWSLPASNGNGGNCTVTAVYSAAGAPVITPFTFTEPSCCGSDAGTVTVTHTNGTQTTLANGTIQVVLCPGGSASLTSNNNYTLPGAGCLTCVPGLMYAIYTGAGPTVPDPDLDPNWTGYYWTGEDFTAANSGGLNINSSGSCSPLLTLPPVPGYASPSSPTNTLLFVPITADAVDLPNHDNDDDGCFDIGSPVSITYLNPVSFNPSPDCNGNVSVNITGGYPEFFSAFYTLANTGAGTLSSTTVSSGGNVVISGLTSGQTYSFSVNDGNGCIYNYSGTYSGPPTVAINPASATICTSACVNLVANVTSGVGVGNLTFTSNECSTIPDAGIGAANASPTAAGNWAHTDINVSGVCAPSWSTGDLLTVCLNISHSYDEDLNIYLRAPNGTYYLLSDDNGVAGDNYNGTCFSATAVTNITAGAAPFSAGPYRPEGAGNNFAALNGTPINGTWSLWVADDVLGDIGTLNNWSITFANKNTYTYAWSPAAGLSATNILNPTACPAASTTYTLTVTNSCGCPAVATTTIDVTSSITPTFNAIPAICSGSVAPVLPATSNEGITGTWAPAVSNTTSGTYTFTPDAGQCAITTTLFIMVNPAVTSTTDVAVCDNQLPYNWNGNNYPAAGTYPVTLVSSAGCDSIATLNLTVNPVVTSTTDAAVCDNQLPYSWNGNNYPAAGSYPVTLVSSAGCDSIATLNLTVNPAVTSTTDVAVCDNQLPYNWNGNNYPAAGTYPVTLVSSAGCDSIATLNLNVNPVVTSTTDVAVCDNQLPYSWNGNNYPAAGTYPVTLVSSAGCDSIATLNLTVNPVVTSITDVAVCDNQLPYNWNGNNYPAAGTYPVTLVSSAGCDSIATLNLTVNAAVISTTDVAVCDNQLPYSWNGNNYPAAGTYPVTLVSSAGCDSIATLNLTVNPVVTSITDVAVCDNQLPYNWNGNNYPAAGTYPVTLVSSAGCDSIATLNLTVNPAVTSITDVSVCDNQLPYNWNGNNYPAAGTYPVTLVSSAGCDSIATLNLTVNPVVTSTTDIAVCDNQLPYSWNGNNYPAAGTYPVTLVSSAGCDSIATLNLTVNPAVTSITDVTVCNNQLPYSWNGNNYPAAGTYPVTLVSSAGCDSIATLNLTVNPVVTSTIDIAVCDNQLPYSWNGNNYPAAGTYPVTLVSSAGCDSIATLNLTVNPAVTSTTDVAVCDNQLPYSWNGNNYPAAGTYPVTLVNSAGCDSIATLNLTVNPVVTSTTDAAVCDNQLPYSWNGNNYPAAGTYPVTLVSSAGCDSIATLNLTVNPAVTSTTDVAVCDNQLPYSWNGNNYPAAGTYPVTLVSSAGCDSIATLNLTVNPVVTSTTNVAVCDNQLPYSWNGNNYPAAGTYPVTLVSSAGCDSIATLNLTVNPVVTSTTDAAVCDNQLPYSWNGNNYPAAGTYPVTLVSSAGCDSIATLNLTVNPAVTSTTDVAVCDNQLPYSWNGNNYPAAGTYPVTLVSSAGCDSIATLNLTVNPVVTSTTNVAVCDNQLPYSWNGNNYPAAGTYPVTLVSSAGCDSIATLNLTVNPVVTSTTDVAVCDNQLPYNWNGNNYPAAGTYSVTLVSSGGCDSIATLNLTVNPVVTSTTDVAVCDNQLPYNWNGNNYPAAGSYPVTLVSSAGCDSIATLNLTVNPVVTSTTDVAVCDNQLPYSWNGNNYPAAGTYPVTLVSSAGCDSIATLNLNVNPVVTSTTDVAVCDNQLPYNWNGNNYPAAGTYPITLVSSAGCDSIATLNLTVNPVVTSTTDVAVCDNQLPYNWNGNNYPGAGTYPVTLVSSAGCDSIATLNLTVNSVVISTTDVAVCDNQLPYSWNGNNYPAAGTYPITLVSSAGCDSIATLNLTVNPVVTSTTDVAVCDNQLPYNWNGNNYPAAGTYPVTLVSSAGCDSIATLNLTVNPVVTSTTDIAVCDNQLPYNWNGNNYPAAGTYSVTLVSSGGCDSIATLNLTVNPVVTSTTDVAVCDNQLPYNWNGNNYPGAGTYPVTLVSSAGCDSIATLNLTVNPVVTSTTDVAVCDNQLPYSWNGNNYPAAGTYPVTLVSSAGCDSIATLNLTVNPVVTSTTDVAVCDNQLPYSWNGNNYPAAGTYPVTLVNSAGCDSIATLNLTVNPAVTSTTNITICDNQLPYSWNGNSYPAAGTYSVTLVSSGGCDSIATLNLNANAVVTSTTDVTICDNQLPYSWNGNSYPAAGTYSITLVSSGGCDSIATLNLNANAVVTSTTDVTICDNQLPYSWNGNSYPAAGTYSITLVSSGGCDSIATLNLNANAVVTSTTDVTICDNQLPYSWNGNSYPAAGTYSVTLVSSGGCDSIAILNLNANAVVTSTTDVTICDNQLPYSWNGNSYPAAGTYSVILVSSGGCDSIATLNLNANAVVTSTTDVTICDNQLPYSWNGNSYPAAGTYSITLVSSGGCDSIATLNLNANAVVTSTTNITICDNQLPYSWNGNNYPAAGTYSVTLVSSGGCDSIATLNLTVNPVVTSTTNVAVCDNQLPYNWNGNNYPAAGTYSVTLVSSGGCDSIATLNLNANAVVTSTTDITICTTQLPYNWNGNNYPAAGTYSVTLVSSGGCDSIATLNLNANAVVTSTTDITICTTQLPYNWNGNSYPAAGTYSVTLVSSGGCDSIATLNLNANAVVTSTTDITICTTQLPYNWNGNSYPAAGTYSVTLVSSGGCDSIATLNLNANAVVTSTIDVTICDNQLPYSWNGNSYPAAGTYSVTLVSSGGCDSIATLNLNANAVVTSTTDVTICDNQLPYSWNGNSYPAAGTYSVTLVSSGGCDSIATLNLNANAVVTSNTDITICTTQLPYNWNGNSYPAAGTYSVTLVSSGGCDSIATLNLNANAVVTSTTDVTICDNQLPYSWNGNSYPAAGTYSVTLVSSGGCDSIATLNLNANAVVTSTTDITICDNQLPYSWNGNSYPSAGTYSVTLVSSGGCDSIATLNLNANAVVTSTTDITICTTQLPYSWNGNSYPAVGTYSVTLVSSGGCDSIATLNLNANAVVTSTTDITICTTQLPYSWNGNSYPAAGTYSVTLVSSGGCDSIATLNLNANAVVTSTTDVTICTTQLPYNWNGNNYPAAGTYSVTLVSSGGCDSIATLNLNANAVVTSTTDITICTTQLPYNWNGNSYPAAGTYSVMLVSSGGCDSIATLNLNANAVVTSTTDVTICTTQLPYSWNGNSYPAAGTYSVTLVSSGGCDSIATLNLNANAVVTSTTNVTICDNQLPYSWNGNSYPASGTYSVTLVSSGGCDSIATLNLTANAVVTSTTDITICDNQLPYSWNGNSYPAAGTYSVTLVSSGGCDSIATLNLNANAVVTSSTDITICTTQLPYNWNGNSYPAAGTYSVTLVSSGGCDSIATLNLNANAVVTSTTDVTICTTQLPYNWNGNNYPAAGTYSVTLVSSGGCDSIATLNLNANAVVTSTTDVTICTTQLPYNWNGNSYPAAGTYSLTLVSSGGCDSIATLNLNANAVVTSTTDVTICTTQLPYNWNGNNYPAAGTYSVTLVSSGGCDSIATLNLNANAVVTSTTDITICDNQLPYSWNGNSYPSAGTYSVTLVSSGGCDSIATLNLNANAVVTSTTDITICTTQLPYSWNGNSYPAVGTYSVTLVSSGGCDSIATLNLNANAVVTSTTDITICTTQLPYSWNGNSYPAAGTYSVTLVSSGGCDSIATLNLNANAVVTSTTDVTICTTQLPYNWNGNNYPAAGTYSVTLVSSGGCDSIATLNLNANAVVTSTTDVTICTTQLPYSWNGNSYPAAGTYSVTLVSSGGCDSIATLNLNANAVVTSTTNVTICDNQLPYSWNGNSYPASGTYSVTLVSSGGCDSIATLNLTANAVVTSTTDITICDNQLPYSWNGNSYPAAGTYSVTLVSSGGCDSIATLNLNANAVVTSTTDITICTTQLPYNWNGNSYPAAGTYSVTLVSSGGCDSIATLNLNANAVVTSTTDVTICDNQLPYSWNGNSYPAAGTYSVTLVSSGGCDSIATLNLNANAVVTSTTDITICTTQLPYNWNGNSYPAAGTYSVTLVSSGGCDSIATLNLNANAVVTSTTDVTICDNQLPYSWNGNSYPAAGTYSVTLVSSGGCDSIATLNLNANAVVTSTTDVTICTTQLPYSWNGNSYPASGTYSVTLVSSGGCDSIATLILNVNNTTISTTPVTVCSNQLPYNWNGNNYSTAGTYIVTLVNSSGCDSVATLILTIYNTTTSTTAVTICDNQLPYSWNGQSYSTGGAHVVTLVNAAGCDSIATLNLTLNPVKTSSVAASTCANQLPYLWNGQSYNTGGAHSVTLSTSLGCDSIVTLTLTINPVNSSFSVASTCDNQLPYLWNGQSYNTAGIHTVTLTSPAGCDSIATLTLTINPVKSSTTDASICSAALPYVWNGQSYNTGGAHTVTLISSAGCDSVATLNLTVNQTPLAPAVTTPVTYCQHEPTTALGATITTPGSQLLWYTSATGGTGSSTAPVPSSASPGSTNYYVSQVLGPCEGPRALIIVTVNSKPDIGPDKPLQICFGQSADIAALYNTAGYSGNWTFNQFPVNNPAAVTVAGIYQLVVQNISGCADTALVTLGIQPPVIANAGPDDNAEYNAAYQLTGSGGVEYQWSPGNVLNNPFISNPLAVLTHDETFILMVKDEAGCADFDTVRLRVLKGPTFYVPTAFSPNGDGLNDIFRPTAVGIQSLEYFRVFNRYGELIFETHDLIKGWDGTYKGVKQNIDNYVWTVKGTDRRGLTKTLKGNVVLIR